MSATPDRPSYVAAVLELYRQAPTTAGRVRRADRHLAGELYQRGVPLETIENAILLTAVRRLTRNLKPPGLPPIRSLHYFLPVLDEVQATPLPAGYVSFLRLKLRQLSTESQAS